MVDARARNANTFGFNAGVVEAVDQYGLRWTPVSAIAAEDGAILRSGICPDSQHPRAAPGATRAAAQPSTLKHIHDLSTEQLKSEQWTLSIL